MSSKINWLVSCVPTGALVVQQWLTANGISYSLAQRYTQSGWLKKISAGVYYRPSVDDDVKPNWVDAIQTIDNQLGLPIHVAGLSSLTLQGLNHYLQVNEVNTWVGVNNRQSMPKWFRQFKYHDWVYCAAYKFELASEKYFKVIDIKGKGVKVSCPELSAYEVVNAIGKAISFEHVAELFQGLVNLSPRKVQSILEQSEAIQTNRIYLFLGRYYNHQWMQRIDETKVKLGAGKRQVVEKGYLDERYQITVPQVLGAPKNG